MSGLSKFRARHSDTEAERGTVIADRVIADRARHGHSRQSDTEAEPDRVIAERDRARHSHSRQRQSEIEELDPPIPYVQHARQKYIQKKINSIVMSSFSGLCSNPLITSSPFAKLSDAAGE